MSGEPPEGRTPKNPRKGKNNFKSPLKGPTRGSENFAQNVGPWGEGTLLTVVYSNNNFSKHPLVTVLVDFITPSPLELISDFSDGGKWFEFEWVI